MKVENKHILIYYKQPSVDKDFFNLIKCLVSKKAIVSVVSFGTPLERVGNCLSLELNKMKEMGAFSWGRRKCDISQPIPIDSNSSKSLEYHWIILWDPLPSTWDEAWKLDLINACAVHCRLLSFQSDNDRSDIDLRPFYCSHNYASEIKGADMVQVRATTEGGDNDIDADKDTQVDQASVDTDTESTSTLLDSPPRSISTKRKGVLYLVGMGLGSPDLLTLRAHRLLHSCPVIISDRLVCSDIYADIPASTRLYYSRKVCGKANQAQAEIHNWILENLNAGRDVMRAKGGDPFVFGRGGEEWNVAKQAGFRVEWVPGISSSIAGAGAAGIPVTHRGVADSFVVATGQLENGSNGTIPSYSSKRTLVLLMAVGVLETLQSYLEGIGYPLNVPVAVVHRATWPDQRVVKGSLTTISLLVKEAGIKSHAAIVVGHVVNCLE